MSEESTSWLARVAGSRGVRALLASAAVLASAGALWAHAVVVPGASTTRAYQTYTLRVPNEKDVPTTRIEIAFPPELFVVSFAEVPGWRLSVDRDETDKPVAATWTGELAADRFVELPFVGVNPAEPTTLVWVVDQTYAGPDGEEVVSWSGPADSEFPASRTEVRADDASNAPASGVGDGDGTGGKTLSLVAVLLSMIALVVATRALRERRS